MNIRTKTIGEAGLSRRYRLFGLSLDSSMELPELRPDERPPALADVTIRRAPLPEPRHPLTAIGEFVELSPSEFRLTVPDVARFFVRDGREVFVEALPGAADTDLRAYLLGSVLGALVHQAGLLPLHASAVARGDQAAAFLGASGAGKSTIAHRLSGRGFDLLSDDVCVVHAGGTGDGAEAAATALVWPGIRQFKLWDSSLAAAGESKAGLSPVLMREDKFLLPASGLADDRPHRLGLLYVLGRSEGTESRFAELTGLQAVNALVSNTYRGLALNGMGRSAWHFRRCTELARECRIFTFAMAWGFERAETAYATIEAHMLEQFARGT
ncbi:MAG: hypothetical protein JWP15_59 [Alphaproteobacteria bacterium]|nr:hypothetical protein [Alphaproteobacteria bacterium]